VTITYCSQCHWLLRAAWMAQELLSTFGCPARGFLDTRCCYAAALIGARAANHSRLV
jgi:Ni,Fe-hydrogenase I small subunit